MKSTLKDLKVGETCAIRLLQNTSSIRRRLIDIGLIKDTKVECVLCSPGGDPKAYMIRGAVIAIRSEDAKDIIVEK